MLLKKEDSLLLIVDVQEKLLPAILNTKPLLSRIEWLSRLAKKMNVPILVSEQYTKGLGGTTAQLHPYYENNNCIEKIHFSCMQEPAYTKRLRDINKNQFVIVGIEAHVCVLQTAMDMKSAGLDVYVVVDAVGSRNELDLKYGLKRMKQDGIHLITAEMVFFEWQKQAGTPEFKALSKEFLQ